MRTKVSRIARSAMRWDPDIKIGEADIDGDLFVSWEVMSRTTYEPPEYLIYGLCRGDVGMVQAVTITASRLF
jgi:hypothetical protein